MRIWALLAVLAAVLLLSRPGQAETSEEQGLAIALEADRRGSGFNDFTADMEMVLRDGKGKENHRIIKTSVVETAADGDKSLTVFESPGDVRGTALLTHTHKVGDDDQWLYLPALKRVKRISTQNRSGSFMGSEFAYEDLGSRELEKYDFRYLTDETVAGRICRVVQLIPKDLENSGYSRILSWLDRDEYRIRKEEYYDKRERLLKTLSLEDYRQYLGFLWRAHRLRMVNHQNGKETDLLLSDFKFRTGLTERDFHQSNLQHTR